MDTTKHIEFFNPGAWTEPIHIIGCGALGSNLAIMLTRLGFEELYLWDMDIVDEHNITNQGYRHKDIGKKKLKALDKILKEINPQLKTHLNGEYQDARIGGAVFLLVDSIEKRKEFVEQWQFNDNISIVLDGRMRLTDGQVYVNLWSNPIERNKLLETMQFTTKEAKEATPVSACGTQLSVLPTVWMLVSVLTTAFMKHIKKEEIPNIILLDSFTPNINKY